MKKKNIILYTLLLIACLAFEFFFCNSLFLKGKSSYVFSFARLFIYVLLFVICYFVSKRIITERISYEKEKKKINFLDIFLIFAILFIVAADIILLVINKTTLMGQGIVIIGICYLLFILLFYNKNYKLNILMLCSISMLFSLIVTPQHALDEPNHFITSYNVAHFDLNYGDGFEKNESLSKISMYKNFEFNEKLFKHYNEKQVDGKDFGYDPVDGSKYIYLPSSLGILVSEIFNGTIMDTFYIGRIFNALCMLLLLSVLLKTIPFKLNCYLAIITTPFFLMLGGTYSIDGIGNLIMLIFIAYILKLYMSKDKYINIKNIIVLVLLMLGIICFKDAAYFLLFLLLILLFKKVPKNRRWLIIPFVLIMMFLVYKAVMPSTLDTGDTRGTGENNIQKQLAFLLSSPIVFIKVYGLHFLNCFFSPAFYSGLLGVYFFPIFGEYFVIPYIIYLIYMGISSDEYNFSIKNKIIILIIAMLVFFFTSTGLYLSYTEVGSTIIAGYQSRYTFTIMIMLLMLISNKKIQLLKIKDKESFNFNLITIFNVAFLIMIMFANLIKYWK